jgi:lipoyl(octanoyl) transferase
MHSGAPSTPAAGPDAPATRAPAWRIEQSGKLDGATNMATDTALAEALAAGTAAPTLRLYGWSPWAISLGYNQREEEIDTARCRAEGIDVVRRPTGGRAILHAEELTYCVVMPAGRRSILEVYNEISRALVRGLGLFGVEATLQRSQPNFPEHYRSSSAIPCFTASARYEIEWDGRKLVGSAQRRVSGATQVVLQHGSILCGPAHKRLTEFIRADDGVRELLRAELDTKTVDLSEATGRPVDVDRLAECIRKGCELHWGVRFDPAA